jgi:hypothetical protein
MIGDTSLYPHMAQAIFDASPAGAVKLIMRASLAISDDGDVGEFEFDFVDQEGTTKWFPMGSGINTGLIRDLLTKLRQSYIDSGQDAWNKCEFIVDVELGKFEFNIDYEDG